MTRVIEKENHYLESFQNLEPELRENGAAWLPSVRKSAISRFAAVGFPSRKNEEWKYTSVAPITAVPFEPAVQVEPPGSDVLAPFWVEGLRGPRLVFLNGRFSAELSEVPPELEIGGLGQRVAGGDGAIEHHLSRWDDRKDHAFTDLNTAFFRDGLFVRVPARAAMADPIQVVYLHTQDRRPQATHLRNLILVEPGSQLRVVEIYASLPGSEHHLVNAVTDIAVGEEAQVEHYKLQYEQDEAFHLAKVRLHLGRRGRCFTLHASLGGALVRNEIEVNLEGEQVEANIHGLWVVDDDRHVDFSTLLEHARPHCNSRQVLKGIVLDQARSAFTGKIHVHQDAQKTDAFQSNDNLVLTPDGVAHTRPRLEIYADDVRCSHGATIGQLDEKALFYLRSRGIDAVAARHLLIEAFAHEAFEGIALEPVGRRLGELLLGRLPRRRGRGR